MGEIIDFESIDKTVENFERNHKKPNRVRTLKDEPKSGNGKTYKDQNKKFKKIIAAILVTLTAAGIGNNIKKSSDEIIISKVANPAGLELEDDIVIEDGSILIIEEKVGENGVKAISKDGTPVETDIKDKRIDENTQEEIRISKDEFDKQYNTIYKLKEDYGNLLNEQEVLGTDTVTIDKEGNKILKCLDLNSGEKIELPLNVISKEYQLTKENENDKSWIKDGVAVILKEDCIFGIDEVKKGTIAVVRDTLKNQNNYVRIEILNKFGQKCGEGEVTRNHLIKYSEEDGIVSIDDENGKNEYEVQSNNFYDGFVMPYRTMKTTTDDVNIRIAPGGNTITSLPIGTEVKAFDGYDESIPFYDNGNNWTRFLKVQIVMADGTIQYGYIAERYLEETDEKLNTPTEKDTEYEYGE